MKAIWKFPLKIVDVQTISAPRGATPLCVHAQNDEPQLWALVTPSNDREEIRVRTYGTGHAIVDDPGKYLGTYQVNGGAFVFHVFEAQS